MHSAVYTLKEVCLDHCFHCFNPAPLMQYTVGSWLWGATQIKLHWPCRDGVWRPCVSHTAHISCIHLDWRRIYPSLVGCMETALERPKKKGSGLSLRTGGMGTVERTIRKMLLWHRLHYSPGALNLQPRHQLMHWCKACNLGRLVRE
jgi:hypothetical protein